MKKIMVGVIGILAVGCFSLFMLYRSVSAKNSELESKNQALTATLTSMQDTLKEKLDIINKQNKKYQEILASIEYNECENLPVSTTLVEAAKELQK